MSAFVFGPDPAGHALAAGWSSLARFRALLQDSQGLLRESATGQLVSPFANGSRLAPNLEKCGPRQGGVEALSLGCKSPR